MNPVEAAPDVTRVIQLAIAPVFLLTAISGMLNVFANRLGRIVDRMRVLLERGEAVSSERGERMKAELQLLSERRVLVNWAIGFAASSALLVCLLIAVAFVGSLVGFSTTVIVASLFICAMVCFVVSLICFLREIARGSGATPTLFH